MGLKYTLVAMAGVAADSDGWDAEKMILQCQGKEVFNKYTGGGAVGTIAGQVLRA